MINRLVWAAVAKVCAITRVADYLVTRAKRTPYYDITSADGTEVYMGRWWLFNPYGKGADGQVLPARWSWLPSIRVHHIMRKDDDRDLHDHPWNARTIILRGSYLETVPWADSQGNPWSTWGGKLCTREQWRQPGQTARILFGQYHRIKYVSPGGVYTLFITWKYRGTWGFLVDGKKVPYKDYLAERDDSMVSK